MMFGFIFVLGLKLSTAFRTTDSQYEVGVEDIHDAIVKSITSNDKRNREQSAQAFQHLENSMENLIEELSLRREHLMQNQHFSPTIFSRSHVTNLFPPPHDVYVTDVTDTSVNTIGCAIGGSCNLRSAISYCELSAFDSCTVFLPPKCNISLESGPIAVSNVDLSLHLVGNDCEISSDSSVSFLSLIADSTHSLQFYATNLTTYGFSSVFYLEGLSGVHLDSITFHQGDGNNILLISSQNIQISSCTFLDNTALSFAVTCGSNILMTSSSNISISDNIFRDNTAFYGGAMCIMSDNYDVYISRNIYTGNIALEAGGVYYFHERNTNLNFQDNFYHTNEVHGSYYGGGVAYFNNDNTFISIVNVSVINCQAPSAGGAGYSFGFKYNNDLLISDSTFIGNYAYADGGAVAIYDYYERFSFIRNYCDRNMGDVGAVLLSAVYDSAAPYDINIIGNIFTNNYAYSAGGAVALDTVHYSVKVLDNLFENNTADITGRLNGWGGALYCNEINTVEIMRNKFINNLSQGSGGAIRINRYMFYADINDNDFLNNVAIGYEGGGAMCLSTTIFYNNYLRNSYVGNRAVVGGALSFLFESIMLEVSGNFTRNFASLSGGAVYYGFQVNRVHVIDSLFDGNRALTGGGVYMTANTRSVTFNRCTFINNEADRGSAISATLMSTSCSVTDSVFVNNRANYGTISLGTYMTNFVISGCVISSNIASEGGGIWIDQYSTVIVRESIISRNNVTGKGGGLYISSNGVQIISTAITNNFAVSGGGLYIVGGANSLTDCHVERNVATDGGGLYLANTNNSQIIGTNFTSNAASAQGGGAYILSSSRLTLEDCLFMGNIASIGGAASVSSTSAELTQITFSENTAQKGNGGAIAFLASSILLTSISFLNNLAPKGGGGAVFWKKSSPMNEPLGLIDSALYTGNQAKYGNNYATESVSLRLLHNGEGSVNPNQLEFILDVYQASFDLKAIRLDEYNQIVNVVDVTSTYATVATISDSSNCSLKENAGKGYLRGANNVLFVEGVASFTDLLLLCGSGKTLTIGVYPSMTYIAAVVATVRFRECRVGEFYEIGVGCLTCPIYTYSLNFESEDTKCKPCPSTVKSCNGSNVELHPGQWRISNLSTTPLLCPMEDKACQGGLTVAEQSCNPGYTGSLCGVCADEYYYSTATNTCEVCVSSGLNPLSYAFIAVTIFVALVLFATPALRILGFDLSKVFAELFGDVDATMDLYDLIGVIYARVYNQKCTREEIGEISERLAAKMKTYLSFFQILSSLSFVYNLRLPAKFTTLGSLSQIANINFPSLVGLSCRISYDYVDYLMLATLFPVVVSFIIFIGQALLSLVYPNSSNAIKSRAVWLFLFWTFLVLPGVCTAIFRTFSCVDVDPNNDIAGSTVYLVSDLSLSCSSDRYRLGVSWALWMILVYPIGVPMLYLICLYKCKDKIRARQDVVMNSAHAQELEAKIDGMEVSGSQVMALELLRLYGLQHRDDDKELREKYKHVLGELEDDGKNAVVCYAALKELESSNDIIISKSSTKLLSIISNHTDDLLYQSLKFLYAAYEPEYWYWEIVETLRRICLTGVLVLVAQGTAFQVVVGMVIALIFIKLYGYFLPFEDDLVDRCNEIAMWQVFGLYFVCLLIRVGFNPGILDIVLLVICSMNIATDALESWILFVRHWKEMRIKWAAAISPSQPDQPHHNGSNFAELGNSNNNLAEGPENDSPGDAVRVIDEKGSAPKHALLQAMDGEEDHVMV